MKTYAIVIPSIKDRLGLYEREFIQTMIPSMRFLHGLGDNWKVVINFQLYSREECKRLSSVIERHSGLEVAWVLRDYSGSPVPMRLVRQECAELFLDVDYYLFADDNMRFKDGLVEFYGRIDKYLTKYPDCGWLQCMGFLGGYHHEDEIIPLVASNWNTNRGLFLKNILSERGFILYPHDTLLIPGGHTEPYAVFSRMEMGYHGAKVYNSPVIHWLRNTTDGFKMVEGRTSIDHDVHNPKNLGLVFKDIEERWGPIDKWMRNRNCLPEGVLNQFNKNCRNPDWADSILEW